MSGRYLLYCDGASRGNPGDASIGAILYRDAGDELEPVETIAETIGYTTNNQAEYRAVIAGVEAAIRHEPDELVVRADSLLVVNQLNGDWRVKDAGLRPLAKRVAGLLRSFPEGSVRIEHVPREENEEADALANAALDGLR